MANGSQRLRAKPAVAAAAIAVGAVMTAAGCSSSSSAAGTFTPGGGTGPSPSSSSSPLLTSSELLSLLPKAPKGWTVTHRPKPLTVAGLANDYSDPTSTKHDLQFDFYESGAMQTLSGPHLGVVDEIWQFQDSTGAGAWFKTFTAGNQPGTNTLVGNSFTLPNGGVGYLGKTVDTSGYHYGVAIEQQGNQIVHARVFSVKTVTQPEVAKQLASLAGAAG